MGTSSHPSEELLDSHIFTDPSTTRRDTSQQDASQINQEGQGTSDPFGSGSHGHELLRGQSTTWQLHGRIPRVLPPLHAQQATERLTFARSHHQSRQETGQL